MGIKATLRPNAHTHILAIAAQCLALADRGDEARAFWSRIQQARPEYSMQDFLSSFHFPAKDAATFQSAAMSAGIFPVREAAALGVDYSPTTPATFWS